MLAAVAAGSHGKASLVEAAPFVASIRSGAIGAVILTGNYPSDWSTDDLIKAVAGDGTRKPFTILVDTLGSRLADAAELKSLLAAADYEALIKEEKH